MEEAITQFNKVIQKAVWSAKPDDKPQVNIRQNHRKSRKNENSEDDR
jgi:aromatic ring-opening dioxygenase catalytic subunit (LigB family)